MGSIEIYKGIDVKYNCFHMEDVVLPLFSALIRNRDEVSTYFFPNRVSPQDNNFAGFS